MDWSNIISQLNDELNNQENTSDTPSETDNNNDEWYKYGVKRITGETVYWSQYIEDTETSSDWRGYGTPDGNIGTLVPLYIGTYLEYQNGGNNTKEQTLFISKSGVRITAKIYDWRHDTYPMTVNNCINYTQQQVDNTTWSSVDVYTPKIKFYIMKHDYNTGVDTDKITLPNTGQDNYSCLVTTPSDWSQYPNITTIFNNCKYSAMYTRSYNPTYASGNGLILSGNNSVYFAMVYEPTDDSIRFTLVFKPYYTEISNDAFIVDNYYFAKTYAKLTKSSLNNYFDEDIDGGVKEQDDNPPWKDDTSDTNSKYKGRYGNYPDTDIDFPQLPTVSAIDTGFITLYNPTSAQLQSLVSYLWSSDWVDNIKKVLNNPFDAIISLQLCPLSNIPHVASSLKVGAINTGLNSDKALSQYIVADCGTLTIPEYYSSALDYAPNTHCEIYLPFIGVRSIDIDLTMDSTIELKYLCDILTGNSIAMIKVNKDRTSKSVYYNYDCNINTQIPITGANYSQVITSLMSLGLNTVGAMVSPTSAVSHLGEFIADGATVMGGKHSLESHGNLGNNTGMLGNLTPYIILTFPRQSLPSTFSHDNGYVSNISKTLSTISGYTEVESIHLDNIPCTDSERAQIEQILKGGVML